MHTRLKEYKRMIAVAHRSCSFANPSFAASKVKHGMIEDEHGKKYPFDRGLKGGIQASYLQDAGAWHVCLDALTGSDQVR
jgi:hypothetical protein